MQKKCGEIKRNAVKCREMQLNVYNVQKCSEIQELQRNAEKCREIQRKAFFAASLMSVPHLTVFGTMGSQAK